jgi:hypothetical protein
VKDLENIHNAKIYTTLFHKYKTGIYILSFKSSILSKPTVLMFSMNFGSK